MDKYRKPEHDEHRKRTKIEKVRDEWREEMREKAEREACYRKEYPAKVMWRHKG